MEYYFGVHLGRVNEPGIICSVSREAGDKRPVYYLNTYLTDKLSNDPFDTARSVKYVMDQNGSNSKHLIVDITNVGETFVDLLKDEGLSPTVLSSTTKDFVDRHGDIWLVPRRDLLMNLLILKYRLKATFPGINLEFVNQMLEKLPQVMVRGLYTEEGKARSDSEGSLDYIYYGFAAALWYAEKGMNRAPKTQSLET